ncbi:MAG: citryl-CoA lyase [Candidatus Eisenbacteria sp.]|nr:citryl-CoA lyase [Candidatus Eisenbacteria bacterium]
MGEYHWKTGVTKIEPNKVALRGYPLDNLIGKISFGQGVYLAIKGELPSENVGRMMEAMLVSSLDHGATPPSTLVARAVASCGSTLNAAIAAGILTISRHHGGAVENCMRALLEAREKMTSGMSVEEAATQLVEEYAGKKRRIAGYGHRIHKRDPRTVRLLELAEELGVAGDFVALGKAVAVAIEKRSGKQLPLNVDGAIATLLCEMEFGPSIANAFFMMARIPGLVAHIQEETTRERPMRVIHPRDHEYDGAEERTL